MFANEAIKDIEKDLKHAKDDDIEKADRRLLAMFKRSHHFYFGNGDALIETFKNLFDNNDIFFQKLGGDLRLPYNTCIFQFEVDNGRVLLCEAITEVLPGSLIIESVGKIVGESKWVVMPSVSFVTISKNWNENEEFMQFIYQTAHISPEDKGRFNPQGNILVMPRWKPTVERVFKLHAAYTIRTLSYSNAAMILLNCRNIVIEDIVAPPIKIQVGKKIKTFPSSKITYHVLKVKAPNTRKKRDDKTNETTEEGLVPLHFRRGHYKEYNQEESNGLFGKLFGRWWWQPHMVGNELAGVSEKDYHILNGLSLETN